MDEMTQIFGMVDFTGIKADMMVVIGFLVAASLFFAGYHIILRLLVGSDYDDGVDDSRDSGPAFVIKGRDWDKMSSGERRDYAGDSDIVDRGDVRIYRRGHKG